MKYAASLAAAVSVAALFTAAQAVADDTSAYKPEAKGTILITLRVTDVIPEANDPIVTNTGAYSGLNAKVGDSIMPTLGLEYFLTSNISVEAIAGITDHAVTAYNAEESVKVYDTWVLPPVITLKYHPFPKARISPYAGAGVNAMIYFSGTNYNGFTVKPRDEFGYAFQGGLDIAVQGPWVINLDAKKVFTNTEAKIDNGALYTHVGLSPWVVSVGLGRKF